MLLVPCSPIMLTIEFTTRDLTNVNVILMSLGRPAEKGFQRSKFRDRFRWGLTGIALPKSFLRGVRILIVGWAKRRTGLPVVRRAPVQTSISVFWLSHRKDFRSSADRLRCVSNPIAHGRQWDGAISSRSISLEPILTGVFGRIKRLIRLQKHLALVAYTTGAYPHADRYR
jgi:hypothetical protein